MRVVTSFLLLCLILTSSVIYARDPRPDDDDYISYLSLRFSPGVSVPLGRDIDYFKVGSSNDLALQVKLPTIPLLMFSAGFGYTIIPLEEETQLSLIGFSGGFGIDWDITPRMSVCPFGTFGYYIAALNNGDGTGNHPYFSTGIQAEFKIVPNLSLGIETAYRNYMGLYNDIIITVGASYHFTPRSRRDRNQSDAILRNNLELMDVALDSVFPVFFKYYDDHPLGTVILKNNEHGTINDIKVTLYEKQYMSNPKICPAPESLGKDDEYEIDLYALFTDQVLELSEGTKLSVNITVEYKYRGETYRQDFVETLRLYDRNAITWEDDRRAAAFVTMKDPTVLSFAKNVAGVITEEGNDAINKNMQTAMGIFSALSLYGINYVVDPSTPYAEYSNNESAVDYLQFPVQTLEYKAGDCDDLSILYCALLESVGIKTAFITVPGHIYMAFSLNMTPEEAGNTFYYQDDLIYMNDNTWIPVEVTAVNDGFLKAWQLGAQEWREYKNKDQAGFYIMNESWEVYEPVGFSGRAEDLDMPSNRTLLTDYNNIAAEIVEREITPSVREIEELIASTDGSPRVINKLGVLYARYGYYDKAIEQFNRILRNNEYGSALFNLGNIYFLEDNMNEALNYYTRALEQMPDNSKVLLGLARVYYNMENYNKGAELYARLNILDSELAYDYAYLNNQESYQTGRASNINEKENLLWAED